MRILRWILLATLVGVVAGFAAGLLRRQPPQAVPASRDYAGGYTPPTPSEDHTAARPNR